MVYWKKSPSAAAVAALPTLPTERRFPSSRPTSAACLRRASSESRSAVAASRNCSAAIGAAGTVGARRRAFPAFHRDRRSRRRHRRRAWPPTSERHQTRAPAWLLVLETAAVGDRPQRREEFRFHGRTVDIERIVEVHLEADRPAADQRHLHSRPVLIRRILDQRPPLQERLVLVRQDQPVARLPDRSFDHVADLDLPLAVAGKVQRHRLLQTVVRQSQHIQRTAELGLDHGIGELQLLDVLELDAAEPLRAPHVHDFDFERRITLCDLLMLDADDDAGELAGLIDCAGSRAPRRRVRRASARRCWRTSGCR